MRPLFRLAFSLTVPSAFVIACGSSDDTATGAVAAGGSSAAGQAGSSAGQAGAAAGQAGAAGSSAGQAGQAGQAGSSAGQAGSAGGQAGAAGGATGSFACVDGGDCVPGEWCAKEVGSAPGESLEHCQCPMTKPSTPVTFACGKTFPKGESGFVCYDPAGAACKVPGAEVVQILGDRIPTACANLVSAGANTVKTSAGAGPLCCYMFSFTGCK